MEVNNISHLLGKEVQVVHYAPHKVSSMFYGILQQRKNGDYYVQKSHWFLDFLFKIFKIHRSYINFSQNSISTVKGNGIYLVHLNKEELKSLFENYGITSPI